MRRLLGLDGRLPMERGWRGAVVVYGWRLLVLLAVAMGLLSAYALTAGVLALL
jgi:hypothetical protein